MEDGKKEVVVLMSIVGGKTKLCLYLNLDLEAEA